MIATWSILLLNSPSSVCTTSGTPPYAMAALIFAWPWPGMSTQVSRMIDIM